MSNGNGLVHLTIDGREIAVEQKKKLYDAARQREITVDTSIYDAAQKLGMDIPILCHREHMNPVAVCRVCVVDVGFKDAQGREIMGRVLAPACYRAVEPNMIVKTAATSPRVKNAVRTVTELLLADHPTPCQKQKLHGDCELESLASKVGVTAENI